MERLTGLANAHSHGLDKLHALEAELSKSANERAFLEKQEKRTKEEANQVSSGQRAANQVSSGQRPAV